MVVKYNVEYPTAYHFGQHELLHAVDRRLLQYRRTHHFQIALVNLPQLHNLVIRREQVQPIVRRLTPPYLVDALVDLHAFQAVKSGLRVNSKVDFTSWLTKSV